MTINVILVSSMAEFDIWQYLDADIYVDEES